MCWLLEPIRSGRKPNIAEFRAISIFQDEMQGVGSLFLKTLSGKTKTI
jgi:hypothetical protein